MQTNCKKIIGHLEQRSRLYELYFADKLPTTMCFSGPAGTGKLMVAKELASLLLCETKNKKKSLKKFEGGCGECRACRTVISGNHPDLHLVQCLQKEDSSVLKIRELLQAISLRSFAGQNRVVIFNDAEQLSIQATNILLKSLEEPRPGLIYILVCSNYSRLPATLLSRCHTWHFNHLSQPELKEILKNHFAEKPDISLEALVTLADGSLDNIDSVASDLEHWNFVKDHLDRMQDRDAIGTLKFMRDISKDKETLRKRLNQIRIYARSKMLSASSQRDKLDWSVFISNMISAERVIFERNIGANYALTASALNWLDQPSDSFTPQSESVRLIDKIVV